MEIRRNQELPPEMCQRVESQFREGLFAVRTSLEAYGQQSYFNRSYRMLPREFIRQINQVTLAFRPLTPEGYIDGLAYAARQGLTIGGMIIRECFNGKLGHELLLETGDNLAALAEQFPHTAYNLADVLRRDGRQSAQTLSREYSEDLVTYRFGGRTSEAKQKKVVFAYGVGFMAAVASSELTLEAMKVTHPVSLPVSEKMSQYANMLARDNYELTVNNMPEDWQQ